LPWLIEWDRESVGHLTISQIAGGAICSGVLGYWVDKDFAGRGIVPAAVALAFDHAMGPVGLHRLEATIHPSNTRSLAVVTKLGFRDEGVRRRYLRVAGNWTDHRVFALTSEDVPEGMVRRWRNVCAASAAESGGWPEAPLKNRTGAASPGPTQER
jgi:ribosomal-protein-alanine N-acetyltransferase